MDKVELAVRALNEGDQARMAKYVLAGWEIRAIGPPLSGNWRATCHIWRGRALVEPVELTGFTLLSVLDKIFMAEFEQAIEDHPYLLNGRKSG